MISVSVSREDDALDLPLPAYQTAGSAGMDLHAAIRKAIILAPGARELVSSGIRIALPAGYEAQIRPRSGLALRHGISMVNTPGTIDSDYRGVISVILINHGSEPVEIKRGDRIAQMVFAPVVRIEWNEVTVEGLSESKRGEGGFGHTGKT